MPNQKYIGNYQILFSEKWSKKICEKELQKAIPDCPKYKFPKRGEKTLIGLGRDTSVIIELVSKNLYSVIIEKDLNVPPLEN